MSMEQESIKENMMWNNFIVGVVFTAFMALYLFGEDFARCVVP